MSSQPPPPLSIAIIGASGLIGRRHAQHVLSSPSTTLTAIVDPSPTATSLGSTWHTPHYPSVSALLSSPHKPSAAIICTPNALHVPVAKELVNAGISILVEKPISHSIREGRELVSLAQERGVKLLVGHHRRFNPYVVAAKRAIENGALGLVTAVSGLWMTRKPDSYFGPAEALRWRASKSRGGGTVMINFVHEIDLMGFFFGEVVRVHAERTVARRKLPDRDDGDAAEEGAVLTLRFASGVVGTFVISDNVVSPHNFEAGTGENPLLPRAEGVDVYRFFGTEAMLSFPDMTRWSYGPGGEKSWERELTRETVEVEDRDAVPFDRQLEHFVRVVRGEEEPSCSGEDGLRALVVCEAVRKAVEKDGSGTVETRDFEAKL